jgi:hypothetical protein
MQLTHNIQSHQRRKSYMINTSSTKICNFVSNLKSKLQDFFRRLAFKSSFACRNQRRRSLAWRNGPNLSPRSSISLFLSLSDLQIVGKAHEPNDLKYQPRH